MSCIKNYLKSIFHIDSLVPYNLTTDFCAVNKQTVMCKFNDRFVANKRLITSKQKILGL